MNGYDTTRLQDLGKRRQKLAAQLAELDRELDAEIPAAAAADVAQVDIIKWTGLARESVRRKCLTDEEREALRERRRKAD